MTAKYDIPDTPPDEPVEDVSAPGVPDKDMTDAVPFVERAVGVGPMPSQMYRFGWGAFLLMPVWGVVYGSVPVVRWWLLSQLVPVAIALMSAGVKSQGGIAAVTVFSLIVTSVIQLWVGMNAYSWLWRREADRLMLFKGVPPRFTVGQFLLKQRKWFLIGMALAGVSSSVLVISGLSSDPIFVEMRRQYALTQLDILVSGAWLGAELILAAWLSWRMRSDALAASAGAGGAA